MGELKMSLEVVNNIPPNQTIYIKNLQEKFSKEDIKRALHAIFGQFGKIIDVVALKTNKLRGQAWVVFSNVSSATNAMKTLQGFPFFDKPIIIQFAKTKSDAIAKIDGTYTSKTAKKKGLALELQTSKSALNISSSTKICTENPPNKMLFVENLPSTSTQEMLAMLFQQFTGFVEVRMVQAKRGIAFVDFETDAHASFAKSGLDNFRITPDNPIKVTYANR